MSVRRTLAWTLLAALTTSGGLTACSGDGEAGRTGAAPSPSASPSASPSDSPSPTTDASTPTASASGKARGKGVPPPIVAEAEQVTEDLLSAVERALATPAAADQIDEDLIAGAAREALLAQAAEYADNDWRVTGTPRVVSMVVRRLGSDRLRVRACLDQSDVTVTGASGDELPRGSASTRTRTIYTLQRAGDRWQVVDQTFPRNPDC